ncbi:MAG TPA: CaiB/BaiF CoA-transferase family protein, partial [Vicinamibacterales bacterium]|nr:CaiB/BaiF CoA-transferase family protein [Vicinamibacterales bacterium]
RVIKIERPTAGDFARGYDATVHGLSSYFVWLNRSKESLTLDLKRPEAADVMARLLSRADVFIQNLAPGATGRIGASTAALRSRYPRLIVCDVSGYGSTGPYAEKKAYDLLVQSEVGLTSITGTDEAPSKVGISVADIAAGMYAYSGILTALIGRGVSGEGAAIEVSLFDALAEWMGAPAYYTAYGGTPPARTGANHASIAPYGPFAASDGREVYLGIQNPREWSRFCTDVLQRPELADDERFGTNALRVRHRPALHEAIDAVFRALTADQILERLEAAQIASARMNTVAEFLAHPQLTGRDAWRQIDSPAGPLRATIPPARISGVEPVMGPVPALGEHREAILTELGFTRDTIARWQKEGVV